jgi:hypothetical protein
MFVTVRRKDDHAAVADGSEAAIGADSRPLAYGRRVQSLSAPSASIGPLMASSPSFVSIHRPTQSARSLTVVNRPVATVPFEEQFREGGVSVFHHPRFAAT